MTKSKLIGILTLVVALGLPGPAQARNGVGNGDKGHGRGPSNLHEPVSSDGSTIEVVDYAASTAGVDGFEGTALELLPDGLADDERAEIPFRKETVDEVWDLLGLPPASTEYSPESIIGTDNRVRVNPTTTFPARAVALITFDGGRCTGWMYGPDIVATAGHCVHTGGTSGTWRTNVRVYPGRNGSTSPYGSCTARTLYSVTGWTSSKSEQYDYGAIKLNCAVGNTTGWFGYWWQSASLTGLPTVINGYPGDKPLEQWRSTDRVRVTETRQVYYENDTTGGMSGGPVYYSRPSGSSYCSGQCAMAIHAYGLHGSSPHANYNHGTRITESVFNNMQAWRNAR